VPETPSVEGAGLGADAKAPEVNAAEGKIEVPEAGLQVPAEAPAGEAKVPDAEAEMPGKSQDEPKKKTTLFGSVFGRKKTDVRAEIPEPEKAPAAIEAPVEAPEVAAEMPKVEMLGEEVGVKMPAEDLKPSGV
jgi:hypothetical protein